MSMDYKIIIKLDAEYTKKNILNVLEKGSLKGFQYHDQINYEQYLDAPIISAVDTANKIIQAYENNIGWSIRFYEDRYPF